jgi:crotonobetainyl-CoA:carnitine CoA-transferase CaiB-like acyl-CoA transferase
VGPLDGFSIVDLSERSPSAAIAGMVFADYGAKVVRVEPAGGDPVRGLRGAQVWLRGQESVTVGDGGLADAELLALCESADVVLDTAQAWTAKSFSYRPPVLEHQVYCLLTAEPVRAEEVAAGARPADDVYGELAEATYGFMYMQDGVREGPIFNGVPHAIVGGAWLIELSTLAALYRRLKTGRGQVVTTSLADAVAILNNWRWLGGGDPPLVPSPHQSTYTRHGNSRYIVGLLECADGRWMQLTVGAKGAANRFFKLLGREDLIDPKTDVDRYNPFTDEEAEDFWEFLPRIFKTKTADEWWHELTAIDVCAMPVQRPGEPLLLEQTLSQGLSHQRGDRFEYGLAARFERTPGQVGPPPVEPGANNSAYRDAPAGGVTRSLEVGEPTARSGPVDGVGPLDGVLVVDAGAYIAGPFGMRLLAELGARVIKVEPLDRLGPPPVDQAIGWNRGKESIALDLKSEQGKEIFFDLVRDADVFDHNQRFGVMERLGLGAATLCELNPRLVYCHCSGYGNHGPWATRPVFGTMCDAVAGTFARTGGTGNPPMHFVSCADFSGGLNSASLVLAGLIERERSGRGQFVEIALLGGPMLWMSDCYVQDGELVETFGLDPDQRGHAPTNALYRTRDGWLVLACYDEREWSAAHLTVGAEPSGTFFDARGRAFAQDVDAGGLALALAKLDTSEALSRLEANGVPCCEPQLVLPEMLLGSDLHRVGPITQYTHPLRGEIFEVGRPLRLADWPDDLASPAPEVGEHTRAILRDLSRSDDDVEHLIEDRVVAEAVQTKKLGAGR